MFFKKSKAPPLPNNWPSPLHNKCTNSSCRFPNPPQPASGTYQCRGWPGGFCCEATYKVTAPMAQAADHYYKELFRIEAEIKRKQQNVDRVKEELRAVRQWEQKEKEKRKMVMEANARYEAEMRTQARRDRTATTQQPPLARRDAQRKHPGPAFGPRSINRPCGMANYQPPNQPAHFAHATHNVPPRWV